ncbi:MAG: RNA polymerase sigma factor [Saprospiraceae bacterium]|nr:RNA polymerase sigma factor [Saprospiraceae bacterium]
MGISIGVVSTESEIILACIRKESWAMQKLYEENYGIMYAICLRYAHSKDEAIDLLHDSFIKIFNKIHLYESGTLLQAWMKRLTVNTCIDYFRKESKRQHSDLEEAKLLTQQSMSALDNMQLEEILATIQKLPTTYRTVFNLHIIDGFSHKEISEILHINESTSRSNLVKARQKLREMIIGNNEE